VLGAVRPTGARRSWWLREALAAETDDLASAAPPLAGSITADVVIVGGGYTGLWAAWHLTEQAPGARIVVLESDICGGGPSGRNGGFVTGWWDELPTLIERHGRDGALAIAREIDAAVDEIGAWCMAHGVDAGYSKAGSLTVSAAPAQDGVGRAAVAACRALGVAEEFVEVSPEEVRARVDSPVFRGGVFMRGAATVQPAILARGLRRVLLDRGVTIHEGTSATELDGERPWRFGALGRRASPGRAGQPVRVRTSSALGGGEVIARSAVVALNAWAAAWPSFGRRLVTWSSYIVLTEPIPERLEELGWTGGEGVADGRFTLHYMRTTRDSRIALGGGGGRAGFGGRIGSAFTDDLVSVQRATAGLRRLFPTLRDVRIEDAWGGPIDITSDHLPIFASLPGRPIHYAHGYSGNGVAPSVLGGRILAALALGRADDVALSLPLVGAMPRAFPPEPVRYLGARVVREAVVRAELAEERGEQPSRLIRELSRVPRRLGYHLGPE
jgi:glycine/D-amino acid oxidase-like deaminating enzyme